MEHISHRITLTSKTNFLSHLFNIQTNVNHLSIRIKTVLNRYYGEKEVKINSSSFAKFILKSTFQILPCWAISW